MKVVLATQNKGKMKEMKALFNNMPIELVMLSDYCLNDIEETGLTFVENALLKARFATEKTGLPAIADDSGLVVPALNGEPGIYSARYAGIGKRSEEHLLKLLEKMKTVSVDQRIAIMHCTLVFLQSATDPMPLIAEGNWTGSIIDKPKGQDGFGYDPIFWLAHENKTAAELSIDEKNQQSHRFQALMKLKDSMAEKLCMPYLLEN
jgi:XTP/dITP diphosphohydrolase